MSKQNASFFTKKELLEARIKLSEAQNHKCAICGVSVDPYSEAPEGKAIVKRISESLRKDRIYKKHDQCYIVCFECKDKIASTLRMFCFDTREVWLAPNGKEYVVDSIKKDKSKTRIVVLIPSKGGRKMVRPDNATNGWKLIGKREKK